MKNNRKKILITSDDGYHSKGVRILIAALKEEYDLNIAATTTQQSGMSGKISVKTGGAWGTDEVDGIEAIWVDGSPCDAIEVARVKYGNIFDLIISGVNWGINLSGDLSPSGTFNAAWRALRHDLAPKSIAMSMFVVTDPTEDHKKDDDITDYIKYPTEQVIQIVKLAFEENFWDHDLLNINFPTKPSKEMKFALSMPKITDFYPQIDVNDDGSYSYPKTSIYKFGSLPSSDAELINQGYITITPCYSDLADNNKVKDLLNKTYTL